MGEMKNEGENKKKGDDGGKKNNSNNDDGGGEKTTAVTVVLKVKMDCECEGCAAKIVKCVRGFKGVETVKSEMAASKLTVTGAVDPAKLREKLERRLKKKVELISPQPKKDKENAKNNNDNNKNDDKNKPKNSDDKKSDIEKKPKEPPVTTAVLKLKFHCQGCIDKIRKTVTKTKGVREIKVDKQNGVVVVTVNGTMDVMKLTANLTEKFKRPVEIVPPARKEEKNNGKESENGDGGGGKKKKGGGGGGGGGAQEAAAAGGGGGGGEGTKIDGINKMEYVAGQPGYGYGYVYQYHYPYGYPVQVHPPQIFSDENPNACAVM